MHKFKGKSIGAHHSFENFSYALFYYFLSSESLSKITKTSRRFGFQLMLRYCFKWLKISHNSKVIYLYPLNYKIEENFFH
jgi:hypothetical protein